jgi:hypothetical protein
MRFICSPTCTGRPTNSGNSDTATLSVLHDLCKGVAASATQHALHLLPNLHNQADNQQRQQPRSKTRELGVHRGLAGICAPTCTGMMKKFQ